MPRDARAILFDLDDTLYPLRRFVLSGFRAVAQHLDVTEGLDASRVFAMLARASRGAHRGRELQELARICGLPDTIVPALIEIIRAHRPALSLPPASRRVLGSLRREWRLAIVSNGFPDIQARKVTALGLRALVDTVVFASQHGSGRGKPDPEPFAVALGRLGVPADRAVFVGDDEHCDLFGASRLGIATVFFGGFRRRATPVAYADAVVARVDEVAATAASLVDERWRAHVA